MNELFWPLAIAIGIPLGVTGAIAWMVLRTVFEQRVRVPQFPEIDSSLLPLSTGSTEAFAAMAAQAFHGRKEC